MTEPDLSLTSFNQPSDPLSAREAAGEARREQFSLEERLKQSAPKCAGCERLTALLRDLMPFVLEDYWPDCATPAFKTAVENARAAIK